MIKEMLKMLPWGKIAIPVLPVILLDVYLGDYLKDLYTINLNNGIYNQFPTSNTFETFLKLNIIAIITYLALSVFSHIAQEKYNYLKTKSDIIKINN